MNAWSVYPQPERPSAPSSSDSRAVYIITASHDLPRINVMRSVRAVWLHGKFEQAYIRFMNRWKRIILSGYAIGLAAFWAVLLVPARTGGWIALVASFLTFVMSTVYSLALRYDVVCLIVRTYEFWFFSIGNLVSAVLLAMYLGDARATMVIGLWLSLQNNILTDANTVFIKGYIATAISVLLFVVFLIVTISFDLIDGVRDFDLWRVDADRCLVMHDVLIHGYSTQAIMLARNIYRRWMATTHVHTTRPNAMIIVCVTLRARVKLQQLDEQQIGRNLPRLDSIVPQQHGPPLVQFKIVPVTDVFPADRVIASAMLAVLFSTSLPRLNAIRHVLMTIAYTGLVLTVIVAVAPNGSYSNAMAFVSFACSATFIGSSWITSQRQLLRRLVFTFDFVFLTGQLVVVHACVCDMLGWGYSALPVVTLWLWIQWVLMSDAVTPVVKHKWGIRRRLPAIIMLIFIVSQILIFAIVVSDDWSELRNRVVVSLAIRGHRLEMRVIPMLLSRMVILFGWSWKILWRMWTIQDDELLMIQGSMTYVNLRREHKAKVFTLGRPG